MSPLDSAQLDLIDNYVEAYQEARERGEQPDLEALCKDHPKLLPHVAAEIKHRQLQAELAHAAPVVPVAPSPLAKSTEPVPAMLGGYVVQGLIGTGGMGVVYLVSDRNIGRRLALKTLSAKYLSAPARKLHEHDHEYQGRVAKQQLQYSIAVSRFRLEADIMGRLQHPTIPPVHHLGDLDDGRPFLVMKLINGATLESHLETTTTPWNKMKMFEDLCHGMGYVHSQGVIHRDIKPKNLMLGAFGEIQIIDWGVAKDLGQQAARAVTQDLDPDATVDGDASDSARQMTERGTVLGTYEYMSPEQANGRLDDIDARTDVFSLGGILCKLLTDKAPYQGTNWNEVRKLAEAGDVSAAYAALDQCQQDPVLVDLCKRCLSPDRDARPPHAVALATAIEEHRLATEARERKRELDLAKATLAAKENRKRRQLMLALVAVLMLGMLGTTLGFVRADMKRHDAETAFENEQNRTQERDGEIQRRVGVEIDLKEQIAKREKSEAELTYNLGIRNMQLANAAYENNDMRLARELLDKVPPEQRGFEWYYRLKSLEGGLFTLYGHTGWVTSVAFSPDGRRIVTGSGDGLAKVWDASTGQSLMDLKGHTFVLSSVAFSADSSRIVTGSHDNTAKVWDARTGQSLLDLKGHSSVVSSVAFSPDGSRIVTGSWDGTVKVWDASTGQPLLDLKGHTTRMLSVAFSPDGLRVVTGCDDGTAKVCDARTGQPLLDFKGHRYSVDSVAFSPDGLQIVTGYNDGTVKVWDASMGQPLLDLKGHTSVVSSVAFSPDRSRIVTGSWDRTAKVWDASTGQSLIDLKGHKTFVTSVVFSPDGSRIVTGRDDGTVKVWDASTGQPLLDLKGHRYLVDSVAFSPDGLRIVTGSFDGTAKVWDVRTRQPLLDLKGHKTFVTSAVFSPDGSRIVTGRDDGTVKVWDASTGQPLLDLKGHTSVVRSVAFSPDGLRIVTGYNDRTVKVWDASTGQPLLDLKGHSSVVSSVAFSPDGLRIVTGSEDYTTKVWDASTGQSLLDLKGHTAYVLSVAFSPDGLRVVTGCDDGTAKVCDARTGQPLLDLKGHRYLVDSVAFSPDGLRIVTGSWDRTAKVWDASTGQLLLDLKGHTAHVLSVAFSPDGLRVVTGCDDGTAKVWDARTRQSLLDLKGHKTFVTSVVFSPDGSRIVTGSFDGTAKVWDVCTRQPLLLLKGHTTAGCSVAFSLDGSRMVTRSYDRFDAGRIEITAKVWDASTGKELPNTTIPKTAEPSLKSPDGRLFAHIDGDRVALVPLTLTADEFKDRLMWSRPNEQRYRDGYTAARSANDNFAARFYLDRLLSMPTQRTVERFTERNKLAADPRIPARTSFHTPALPVTPEVEAQVFVRAWWGDRLSKRLMAQRLLRENKPQDAVPLLSECLAKRPETFPPQPPVEELLLAKAYAQLGQKEEVKRFYTTATTWLDQPREAIRGTLAAFAGPSWAMVGELGRPVDDPRHNTFAWEVWHEADVFRAELAPLFKKP